MDTYSIKCLDDLAKMMSQDIGIRKYLAEMPGPTYQYARFTDWIRPYLQSKLTISMGSTYADSYHTSIRESSARALKNLESYEDLLKEIDREVDTQ